MRKFIAIAAALGAAASPALAAGDAATAAKEPKHVEFSFEGVFGRYDQDSLQRGFQVYRNICAGCHSMQLLSFRNLGQKGGPFYLEECPEGVADNLDCSNPNDNPIVKAIASEYMVQDGPDDYGDMYERPATPADRIPGPWANEAQARAANGGAYPPDMSLLVKARHHGPQYIYSLLTGYQEDVPEGVEVGSGLYYNAWFEGRQLAMAQPLYDDMGIYDEEANPDVPQTVEQYSKDVVHFLTWAAEPKLEQRKQLGFMVVLYLLIFTGILYASYKKIWSGVKH